MAYAIFSKRARIYSVVDSLELIEVTSLSIKDAEVFAAVATSDHPEQALYGFTPGRVPDRCAALKGESPIVWDWKDTGNGVESTWESKREEPTYPVHTFSDDGESEWIDAIVPEYGLCDVRREDLIFDEAESVKTRAGGVQSLQIEFSPAPDSQLNHGGCLCS